MAIEITLAVLGLILSALFSGAEIALLSANPLQIEVWHKQGITGANSALRATRDSEVFLTTSLIGINIANVLTTSFATIMLYVYIPYKWLVVAIVSLTILLIGEIFPKTIFREFPNASMLFFGRFVRIFQIAFFPLIWILSWYRIIVLRSSTPDTSLTSMDRNELQLLFRQVKDANNVEVDVHERQTIARIFKFRNRTVGEIMTQRPDIKAVPGSAAIAEVESTFLESGFSKLPVYDQTIDNIIGVVFLHDFFQNPKAVSEIIRETYFVPESKQAEELLQEFKHNRVSMAIVIDEFGGTAGLVTMEDLSEELFGEFTDAFDGEENPVQILEHGLLVNGNAEIELMNNQYKLNLPPGDYETLAGFLIEVLGHIPLKNETFETESHRYVISSASPTRIEKIFIQSL